MLSEIDVTRRDRLRKWARRSVELVLILAVFFGMRAYQQRDIASGIAPVLEGVLLNGQSISLAELTGKPVLVHFWATWCSICALEQDSIEAISKDYHVISVAMQSGPETEVASYLKENSLTFPVLNDPEGLHANKWGVNVVPASFVIDPQGHIRFTEVGYTTEMGLRGRLWYAGRL